MINDGIHSITATLILSNLLLLHYMYYYNTSVFVPAFKLSGHGKSAYNNFLHSNWTFNLGSF